MDVYGNATMTSSIEKRDELVATAAGRSYRLQQQMNTRVHNAPWRLAGFVCMEQEIAVRFTTSNQKGCSRARPAARRLQAWGHKEQAKAWHVLLMAKEVRLMNAKAFKNHMFAP